MSRPRPSPTVIDAHFVGAADQLADLPPSVHTEIAFGGRSNVGKSSLMNMLLQRKKLVRTSSTPGATRTINVFNAVLSPASEGGERRTIGLVDLPGYGFAHRSKSERKSWGPMIEQYLKHRPGLRRVVVVCDARRGVSTEDEELLDYLGHVEKPGAIAMTKVDKLSRAERRESEKTWAGTKDVPLVWVSAETAEGRDALWQLMVP